MAKKKKSTPDPKVLKAQYRNNYIRELKKVCDKIHPDFFPRLDNIDLKALFLSRGTAVRAIGNEQKIPGWMLKYCDDFIRNCMHITELEIIPGKCSISLMEYSVYFIPLEAWTERLIDKFTDDKWFTDIFVTQKKDRVNQYESYMNNISIVLMNNLSNPAYQLCNIEYTIFLDYNADGVIRPSQQFKLKGWNPREAIIKSGRETRVAIELLYNYHYLHNPENIPPFTPVTLPPSRFGIKKEAGDEPLPAFILRHALNRLEERLGCLVFGYASQQIIESLLHGKVYRQSKSGKVLVEYHIENTKAGYLWVDVLADSIMVRTFLFLTNASTPEGKKLHEHFGLQKEDIKYFNMDKLTPLLESDLLTDEEMCNKLREAGCESLIELCEVVKESAYFDLSEEKKELAAKLKKYMMEGEDDTANYNFN